MSKVVKVFEAQQRMELAGCVSTSNGPSSGDGTHIGPVRDEEDHILGLVLGSLGFDHLVPSRIRFLGSVVYFDIISTRLVELELSPYARGNIHFDRLWD
jgi:hypothetical protein